MTSPVLLINGTNFDGWESVRVTRTMNAVAGAFSFTATNLQPFPFKPGDTVKVTEGGDSLINGKIDSTDIAFDSQSHIISVVGRDKTADLVDSSATNEPGQWDDVTLSQLANAIAGEFGVGVTSNVPGGDRFVNFNLQPSETAFEAIERACRLRGVLPLSDTDGNLLLTRTGVTNAGYNLVQGENVLSATASQDFTNRFNKYIVKAQFVSTDNVNGEETASPFGEANDTSFDGNRTLIIISEGASDRGVARQRAQWEATVRSARSTSVTVRVVGWRKSKNGGLWRENEIVSVNLPFLGVSEDLLISDINYTLGSDGSFSELTLVRKDAFTPQPDIKTADSIQGFF